MYAVARSCAQYSGPHLGPTLGRIGRCVHCAKLARGFGRLEPRTCLNKSFQTLEAPIPHDGRKAVQPILWEIDIRNRLGGKLWVKLCGPFQGEKEEKSRGRLLRTRLQEDQAEISEEKD